jgi:hypothetical protein
MAERGEVRERLNRAVSKTVMVFTPSRVRIPPSPLELTWNFEYFYSEMKAKFFLIVIAFTFFLLNPPGILKAQDEMDFEEFMGMMSETMTDQQLDELSYQLPWDIKVTAYAYGDYSGHGLNDVVLGIKEKDVTPPGSVDVYFFENIGDTTYQLIEKKNLHIVDLYIEVAFMVKDGLCYVTNRDQSNWYFTSYDIENDSLVEVNKEKYPISVGNAGK